MGIYESDIYNGGGGGGGGGGAEDWTDITNDILCSDHDLSLNGDSLVEYSQSKKRIKFCISFYKNAFNMYTNITLTFPDYIKFHKYITGQFLASSIAVTSLDVNSNSGVVFYTDENTNIAHFKALSSGFFGSVSGVIALF